MAGLVALDNACSKPDGDGLVDGLRAALRELDTEALPQRLCCERGGIIKPESWSIDVLEAQRQDGTVSVRLGLFFTEIVGGCNCHDDPANYNEYRSLRLTIACPSGELTWGLD
jgi:hypothetical protein